MTTPPPTNNNNNNNNNEEEEYESGGNGYQEEEEECVAEWMEANGATYSEDEDRIDWCSGSPSSIAPTQLYTPSPTKPEYASDVDETPTPPTQPLTPPPTPRPVKRRKLTWRELMQMGCRCRCHNVGNVEGHTVCDAKTCIHYYITNRPNYETDSEVEVDDKRVYHYVLMCAEVRVD